MRLFTGVGEEGADYEAQAGAVVIVVDDPEEGLAEILIACIGEGNTDVAHEGADDKSVEDDTADQDGLFDH